MQGQSSTKTFDKNTPDEVVRRASVSQPIANNSTSDRRSDPHGGVEDLNILLTSSNVDNTIDYKASNAASNFIVKQVVSSCGQNSALYPSDESVDLTCHTILNNEVIPELNANACPDGPGNRAWNMSCTTQADAERKPAISKTIESDPYDDREKTSTLQHDVADEGHKPNSTVDVAEMEPKGRKRPYISTTTTKLSPCPRCVRRYLSSLPLEMPDKESNSLANMDGDANHTDCSSVADKVRCFEEKEGKAKVVEAALEKSVVFLGKIGHGKTHLVNKLCGTTFCSLMTATSCTATSQVGITKEYGIKIIDTPGFYSSKDIASHVSEQKQALEQAAHSGVYIICKLGRADEMAEVLNKIMDFVGDDDVRVIITHADIVAEEDCFDMEQTKQVLSEQLGVPSNNILIVGKDASARRVESFIQITLHSPKEFRVSKEQQVYVATFNVGARIFNQEATKTLAFIDMADETFQRIANCAVGKGHFLNIIMNEINRATNQVIREATDRILKKARTEISPEELRCLTKQIHLSVQDRMRLFREKASRHLTNTKSAENNGSKRHTCLRLQVHFNESMDEGGIENLDSVFQFKINDRIVPFENLACELEKLEKETARAQQTGRKQRCRNRKNKKKGSDADAPIGSDAPTYVAESSVETDDHWTNLEAGFGCVGDTKERYDGTDAPSAHQPLLSIVYLSNLPLGNELRYRGCGGGGEGGDRIVPKMRKHHNSNDLRDDHDDDCRCCICTMKKMCTIL